MLLPLNPARVLFAEPDTPLPNSRLPPPLPILLPPAPLPEQLLQPPLLSPILTLDTPRTDRYALLFGDIFSDFEAEPLLDENLPMNPSINQATSDSTNTNNTHTQSIILHPYHDNLNNNNTLTIPYNQERMELINSVTSQNTIKTLQFTTDTGKLIPNRGVFSQSEQLLDRLCKELVLSDTSDCSSRNISINNNENNKENNSNNNNTSNTNHNKKETNIDQTGRDWVLMQLEWVLWTFASYERRCPASYFDRLLHWSTVSACVKQRWRVYHSGVKPPVCSNTAQSHETVATAGTNMEPSTTTTSTNTTASTTSSTTILVPTTGKRRRTMYNTTTITPTAAFSRAPRPLQTPAVPSGDRGLSIGIAATSAAAVETPHPPETVSVAQSECTKDSHSSGTTSNQPHRTAAQHFAKRGAMSPLQRCTDIMCLVWPMVLCFSASALSPITVGTRVAAATEQQRGSNTGSVRVTDGWWWTAVQLDTDLLDLLNTVSYITITYIEYILIISIIYIT